MYEILGIPPGLEGLHQAVEAEYRRKHAFRDLMRTILADFIDFQQTRPFVITNLGCRRGDDSDDIDACLLEKAWKYRHIAIDCDGDAIQHAAKHNPNSSTIYIHDNAADPASSKHYPDPVDIVLLRHPEIWCFGTSMWERNEDIWFDMVKHAWAKSHPGSQVVITTYNEKEFKLVVSTFNYLPQSTITMSSINPHRDQTLTRWNHRTDTENCPDYYLVRIKKAT